MKKSLSAMIGDRRDRDRVYSDAAFWNEKASLYEGSAVSMFANRNLNELYQREQFKFIDRMLGSIDGRHVLDVGCGTGRLSRHLAGKGAIVTAFDFAPGPVEIACELNGDASISASVRSVFEVDDIASYDDIVVLGCLTVACRSRDEFRDVISRLYRALRPGGRLVMLEPFHIGFLRRVLPLSPKEAMAEIGGVGFQISERAGLHFWPARFFLAPVEWPSIVTSAAAGIGEAVLKVVGTNRGLADYTGIKAIRST